MEKTQATPESGGPYRERMPTVDVKYFALFRERMGKDEERIETDAATVAGLYTQLQSRLGLAPEAVRAAVNGEFVADDHPLKEGDEVVFVPPVAGG